MLYVKCKKEYLHLRNNQPYLGRMDGPKVFYVFKWMDNTIQFRFNKTTNIFVTYFAWLVNRSDTASWILHVLSWGTQPDLRSYTDNKKSMDWIRNILLDEQQRDLLLPLHP